jgi:MFS family permease
MASALVGCGRLADRIGPRPIVVSGLALAAAGTHHSAEIALNADRGRHLVQSRRD